MDPRLSYLHASDNRYPDDELSRLFNPVMNLTDTFNSLVGEEENHLKVYLRVRPLLTVDEQKESYESSGEEGQAKVLDEHTVQLSAPSSSNTFRNTAHGVSKLCHKFSFTCVYDSKTSQLELFNRTTKPLVEKFIRGQNCLLFTYGATNSGKTYTVQGKGGEERGLLPRALHCLFSGISGRMYPCRDLRPLYYSSIVCLDEKETRIEEEKRLTLLRTATVTRVSTNSSLESSSRPSSPELFDERSDRESDGAATDRSLCFDAGSDNCSVYAVFVSFAEIYNETLYDLLERLPPGAQKRNSHHLGEDRNGNSYIKGLYEVRVDNAGEALKVLEIGKQNLHFATTRLNHNSSRSHCIFTVKLVQLASVDRPNFARVSMFSVCDLAGAERVAKTRGSGDRLKEAGNINTSLLVLSRCIVALRQNQLCQRGLLEISSNSTASVGMNSSTVTNKRRDVPVPYRDSKLTRLLQNFFLGQGVSAMIVNISQSPLLFDETLQVLKFSAIARKIITSRESTVPPPQHVHAKTSFSRLLRQSLNKSQRVSAAILRGSSAGVGRLSVPWADKKRADTSTIITFGEEAKDDTMLTVAEEDEDQTEEDDDDRVQILLEHINKLSETLKRVYNEKKEIEEKLPLEIEERLRHELCAEFSKQLVQVETDWRERLDTELERTTELHEWRIAKLTEYYKETTLPRKRQRRDTGDSNLECTSLDDSIMQFRKQAKGEELQAEMKELKEQLCARETEIETLQTSLKRSTDLGNKTQEEATKLKFQLATLTQNYDALEEKLQSAERVASSATPETEALQALQQQLTNKDRLIKELSSDLHENREMLIEAVESYTLKEEQVATLAVTVEKQAVSLEQVSEELAAAQQLTSENMVTLQERETSLEEAQLELDALKQIVKHLREQLANSSSAVKEKEAPVDTRNKAVQIGLTDLESLKLQDIIPSSHKEESQLESDNRKLRSELEYVQDLLVEERAAYRALEDRQAAQEDRPESVQMRAELDELRVALSKARKENMRMETELTAVTADLEVTREKVDYFAELRDEANTALKAAQSQLLDWEEQQLKLEDKLKQKLLKLETCNTEIAHLQKQLKAQQCENEELQLELSKWKLKTEGLQKTSEMNSKNAIESTEICSVLESKIAEFQELLDAKDKLIVKVQKQVDERETLLDEARHEISAILDESKILKTLQEELLEQKTISCKKVAEYESIIKELNADNSELSHSLQKITEEKSSCQRKLEEERKTHVSAIRYRDCEIKTCQKEVCDVRQQVAMLRKENEVLLSRNSKVEDERNEYANLSDDLRRRLEDMDAKFFDVNQKLQELLVSSSSREDQLKQELAGKVDQLAKMADLEKENVHLREEYDDLTIKFEASESNVQTLTKTLAELEVPLNDQEKLNKLKEELRKEKVSRQIFQKEMQAMREARIVEVADVNNLREQLSQLQLTCQQKDDEVSALEVDLKKALAVGVSKAQTPTIHVKALPTLHVKEECTESDKNGNKPTYEELIQLLRERESVLEELQLKLSTAAQSLPSVTNNLDYVQYQDTLSEDQHSEREQRTPTKALRGRAKAAQHSEIKDTLSVRRSTRKVCVNSVNTYAFSNDDSEEEDWEPESNSRRGGRKGASTVRRTAKNKRPVSRIENPHLVNQENKSGIANQLAIMNETIADKCKSTGRGRRRRVLYCDDSSDTLQCSPDLLPAPPPIADSPHTVVRRNLRTKRK